MGQKQIILLIFGFIGRIIPIRKPLFADMEPLASGNLTEVQKQAISMITEIDKFLISISTLMFGALGFYLTKYDKYIKLLWVKAAFLVSFTLLGLTYYFAFRVYTRLASELSQNALGIKPGKSKILYYLEIVFWTSSCASLILLSIFIAVIFSV